MLNLDFITFLQDYLSFINYLTAKMVKNIKVCQFWLLFAVFATLTFDMIIL